MHLDSDLIEVKGFFKEDVSKRLPQSLYYFIVVSSGEVRFLNDTMFTLMRNSTMSKL